MAINYDELKEELSKMSERSILFGIVKGEMVKRGQWKAKPRGVGFKPGFDPNRSVLKPVKPKE